MGRVCACSLRSRLVWIVSVCGNMTTGRIKADLISLLENKKSMIIVETNIVVLTLID